MTMMSRSYLVIAYMLWMTILIPLSLGLNKCKIKEQQSLLKFKQSITNDPMNRLSSWVDNDDCCTWHGVRCDADTGHVIELDLGSLLLYRYNDLWANCSSKSVGVLTSHVLDSALLGLTELTRLDLSGNDFNGSQIPGFIGSFRQLRYLNLSEAGFSGHIPPQLGHLSNLVLLDLTLYPCGPVQYGTLSSTSLSWASNLSKLQTVNMNFVNLSQALDTIPVLSRLESLTMLSLTSCGLENSHMSNLPTLNSSTSFFGALKNLDLSSNSFKGSLTPSIIRNMSSLVSLSLGSNHFNGSLPLWLTTLPLLEVLDLSYNAFSNMDVTSVWGIMGNPCNFKQLNLCANQLEGQILEPSTNFSKCDTYNLEYLELGGNKFRGTLPSFLGQLKKMKYLDLSANEFQGLIPSSLSGLSALNYLDLSYNKLTGSTQDFLGNFMEIEFLDLSSVTLHGTVSSTIANFSKLTVLQLSGDNLNLDPILDWHPRFQLEFFNMPSCGRLIVIPQWLKNQTQMEYLDLSDNSMTGEFPNWHWNMTGLKYLNLSYNLLSGSITNLSPNLVDLDLSNNFLTGPLPHHHINGQFLEYLDLHNNMFLGAIPSWLCHLKFIGIIDLSTNRLTGKLFEENNGSSLLTSPTLEIIDFSENELSGRIMFDSHVQHWDTKIYAVVLHRNRLHDQIPSQLCSLTALNVLDLSENLFEGSIPPCFGSIVFERPNSMMGMATIRETVKALKETLIGMEILGNSVPIIDLSRNSLTGEIPEEITNLTNLMALNLSYNHLTGGIPERIGNMGSLESLDLSNNRLSGMIPQSMSDLKWIEYLNLSNNNLQGQIPTGNQLQTLTDPSIYTGNQGLCGFPLNQCYVTPHATSEKGETNDEEEENDRHETMWFYIVIMAGVATGFWGVVGTLVSKKRWREAYFGFVEDIMVKCKRLS